MDELTVVWSMESWEVGRLRLYEQNARLHSDADVRKLAAHILQHGFNKSIEVDEEGVILCGHRRLAAAQLLGMKAVPVVQHLHLDAAKKREYRLADSRSCKRLVPEAGVEPALGCPNGILSRWDGVRPMATVGHNRPRVATMRAGGIAASST